MLRVKLALYLIAALSVVLPGLYAQIQAPPCNQQLSSGAVYRGVPALSNDGDQGTEVDCNTSNQGPPLWPACTLGEDNDLNSCSYGELYQCVQYVRRFYSLRNDIVNRVDTSSWKGKNAIDYLKVAADGSVTTPLAGFTAFPNSGAYPPMPDDILVFSEGKKGAGHVAIVKAVTDTKVYLIEENWSKNGLASPTFDPATNTVGSRNGRPPKVYKAVGWVRRNQGVMGNPVPVISSLSPNSLTVGSAPQPLNISGTGFLSTSTVTFNGIPHTAQFFSDTALSIQLSTTDLANTGYFPVIVTNPPPGGGPSNAVNFVVGNPVPSITSLAPSSLPVNSPPQPLTINGTGFVSSSTLNFNGQDRATTFVSSTQLTIQLTSADLATQGSYPVYVTNPPPLGGSSNTTSFIVSAAVNEKVLHSFTGGIDGALPIAPLNLQAANLYGTTQTGGTYGNGTVFQLSPNADGSWTETVLNNFQGGSDGANPRVGVVFDGAGNIYGTTAWAGANGAGTVYQLTPQDDGSWKETVLYNFTGSGPEQAGVILDSSGNLYGTTYGQGAYGLGSVFELTAQPDGSWTPTILHSFGESDGCGPNAEVVFDTTGNLYGTTLGCGTHGNGTVFELSPNPRGNWTPTTLYNFGNAPDGGFPDTALVLDSAGNLYGTTFFGGVNNFGTVFEISSSADGWKETVVYSFDGINDSGQTEAPVTLDMAGNLYGTTGGYDSHGSGAVYKLTHTDTGWIEGLLYVFTGGSDGGFPVPGVILDQQGNLYGTTDGGGDQRQGVAFEILTSGRRALHYSRKKEQPLGRN
jgi:uncharacterized repeat protein (TIGR03803 family)